MRSLLIISLMVFGCGTGTPRVAGSEGGKGNTKMDNRNVDVNLVVTVAAAEVRATLTFVNDSTKDVYLDPSMACVDGRIRNKVFRITSHDQAVPYLLPLAKRRAPDPKDLVRLAPGGRLNAEVRLDTAYGFFPGKHDYEAVYDAFHDQPGSDDLYELTSNEARFSVTR
jgi:hypothetical protein